MLVYDTATETEYTIDIRNIRGEDGQTSDTTVDYHSNKGEDRMWTGGVALGTKAYFMPHGAKAFFEIDAEGDETGGHEYTWYTVPDPLEGSWMSSMKNFKCWGGAVVGTKIYAAPYSLGSVLVTARAGPAATKIYEFSINFHGFHDFSMKIMIF